MKTYIFGMIVGAILSGLAVNIYKNTSLENACKKGEIIETANYTLTCSFK